MNEVKISDGTPQPVATTATTDAKAKPKWETPKLEDVSEQVMAQPYIRFT